MTLISIPLQLVFLDGDNIKTPGLGSRMAEVCAGLMDKVSSCRSVCDSLNSHFFLLNRQGIEHTSYMMVCFYNPERSMLRVQMHVCGLRVENLYVRDSLLESGMKITPYEWKYQTT